MNQQNVIMFFLQEPTFIIQPGFCDCPVAIQTADKIPRGNNIRFSAADVPTPGVPVSDFIEPDVSETGCFSISVEETGSVGCQVVLAETRTE